MSNYFQDNGAFVTFTSVHQESLSKELPAYVYNLRMQMGQPILVKDREHFETLPRVLGDRNNRLINQVMHDYKHSDAPFGVLLTGNKGSGKTSVSECISKLFFDLGHPTIFIDEKLDPSDLRAVVKRIGRGIVFIDEFEKLYDRKEQDGLLTMFSDKSLKGVLFIVTYNDANAATPMINNRPGRFRYQLKFHNVDVDIADEITNVIEPRLPTLAYAIRSSALINVKFNVDVIMSIVGAAKSIIDSNPAATEIDNKELMDEVLNFVDIMNTPDLQRIAAMVTEVIHKDRQVLRTEVYSTLDAVKLKIYFTPFAYDEDVDKKTEFKEYTLPARPDVALKELEIDDIRIKYMSVVLPDSIDSIDECVFWSEHKPQNNESDKSKEVDRNSYVVRSQLRNRDLDFGEF